MENSLTLTNLMSGRFSSFRESNSEKRVFSFKNRGLFLILVTAFCLLCSTESISQTYYSQGNADVNLLASWNSDPGGAGTTPAAFTGTNTWIISAAHSMTMSEDWTVGEGGVATVTIEGTLTLISNFLINITGTLTVNGTLRNSGTYISACPVAVTSGITIQGTYQHDQDNGYLPVATWASGSTCLVTGWAGTENLGNSSFEQAFYNFTWNCPNQEVNVFFEGFVSTVNGTFTLASSGADLISISPVGSPTYGNYAQTGGTYDASRNATVPLALNILNDFHLSGGYFFQGRFSICTLNIGGDYKIEGGAGHFQCRNQGSNTTVAGDFIMPSGLYILTPADANGFLTVGGDFIMEGWGTLYLSQGTGVGNLSVAGNFTHTGGNIWESSTGSGSIIFSGIGTQLYTGGGSLSGTINYTVGSGTNLPLLQMGTGISPSVIPGDSDGTFTILPGATLGVTSADGIALTGATGNIQIGGARLFSPGADYTFNGTTAQITGDGLPTTLRNLVIDNQGGAVTISSARTITGNFSVTTGSKANLGTYTHRTGTLTLGGVLQAGGSYGHSGSGATFIDDVFFDNATGIVNNGFAAGTWLGITSDWNTAANWIGGVPDTGDDVSIISAVSYQPVVDIMAGAAECNDLTISSNASVTINAGHALTVSGDLFNSGTLTINSDGTGNSGSLIVAGNGTGNVTYNRMLRPEAALGDRHFFSSPVAGQTISGFISANSGRIQLVGSDYQIWGYLESDGTWPIISTGSFVSGRGYNIDQALASNGLLSFTGPLATPGIITVAATSPYDDCNFSGIDYASRPMAVGRDNLANYGGGGWNLLGNPFTSAMSITEFILVNQESFDPNYQAVYIYDGTVGEHGSYFYRGQEIPGFPNASGNFGYDYMQAGQGFFILARCNTSSFSFTPAMQSHQDVIPMTKSAKVKNPWPGLQLKAKYGDFEAVTTVIYNENMSAGLDPGYDLGLMSTGPEVEIYTTLAESDNGVDFARQALPFKENDGYIVPIGLNSRSGGEITFSAYIIPMKGCKFWLEDRVRHIFTDLSVQDYTIILPENTKGTGRFFIHALPGLRRLARPRTDGINNLANLRIWTSQNQLNIEGAVSEKATCQVFDTRGHKIFEAKMRDGEHNTFDLFPGVQGVYLVKVNDGPGVVTQMVVLL